MPEAPLTVLAVPRGELWITHDNGRVTHVRPGDLALTRGPDHYRVGDDPETEPTIEIHPGQDCRSLTGEPLEETMSLCVRSWGNHHEGETVMPVGAYHSFGEIGDRLIRALPPVIRLTPDQWDGALVPILNDEVMKDHPGQIAVLDRILDLVVVSALRAWFDRPEAELPTWYRAQSDPVVGTARVQQPVCPVPGCFGARQITRAGRRDKGDLAQPTRQTPSHADAYLPPPDSPVKANRFSPKASAKRPISSGYSLRESDWKEDRPIPGRSAANR